MKKILAFLIVIAAITQAQAQPVIKDKKYPSLLWEISGPGLKKHSYLIGTMHVSNKLAFHLPDSFYVALKNAQVVALETNPETWQEDMDKYDLSSDDNGGYKGLYGSFTSMPSDYLAENTLRFYKYDSKVQRALFSNPSAINSLLYRTYGNDASDFEEDTYLDMYIFQCGKKWGKTVTGVENYGESMRLMAEAYRDGAKDKNKKERSYGDWDEAYSAEKLQEAYRLGNLDLLDSINRYNSTSAAFDEKFLYRRNEIQAHSIDSILRSGSALFVGVGAAHLPGNRGVIELLRRKGYMVRPVKMGERASREKEMVEKIRVPVTFHTETANDGIFKVDVPGKLYKSGDDDALNQQQFADMSNGSYYMVTRVMTNSWMWNHTSNDVYNTVDSLLYENIPGKIISKATITRNGYKGFDIVNRTRRGDLQRYNIFITPFEVLLFKMSGNGDYVKNGPEADKFFNSIQLKEFHNENTGWKKYSPPYGGFAIDLPHDPFIGNDGSWIYDAADRNNDNHYRIIRTDIHNYQFVEEDSFDLGLLDESFMSSEFIDKELSRKQTFFRGYPALDASYRDKSGDIYKVRYIIQGPHYYTLIAHGKKETEAMQQFLNSFEIKPYQYGSVGEQRDTALYYSVRTPWYPEDKKIKINLPKDSYLSTDVQEDKTEKEQLQDGVYRSKVLYNDSTGEKLFVAYFHSNGYHVVQDTTAFDKDIATSFSDTTVIYRVKTRKTLPGNWKYWETIISDTNSSRALWTRTWYRDGNGSTISTEIDTLTKASPFIQDFFDSFKPADTLAGSDPFSKKSGKFFADWNSSDSIRHNRALKYTNMIYLDSTDLPQLKTTIDQLTWNEKKYLDTKAALIDKLGNIRTTASADYLEQLYYAFGDTVQLQYAALENLLQQKTLYAYRLFSKIMVNEPPVLGYSSSPYSAYDNSQILDKYRKGLGRDNGKFMDELTDSLKLTRAILPEILPLINLRDYERTMMRLLSKLLDSNLASTTDYESYFAKFFIEARQELKKQSIAEKKKSIEKAEKVKSDDKETTTISTDDDDDEGNANLNLYASLLIPFESKNPNVTALLSQMLRSDDKRLRYNTMMLLLQRGKPVPDSLFRYFAAQEDYRYELYSDLKDNGMEDKFPDTFNNHLDLGRSALMDTKSYGKPDTLIYMERKATSFKGKKGFMYFFKYKNKKDDLGWKLAVVGMTPEDPKQFEYEEKENTNNNIYGMEVNVYDFTQFTNTKLKEDEPIGPQLDKLLKKLLYSKRKSAAEFYPDEDERGAKDIIE